MLPKVQATKASSHGSPIISQHQVLVDDVNNPNASGPSNLDCFNGGRTTDTYDGFAEFDLHFTCDCSNTEFAGVNCADPHTLIIPPPVGQIAEANALSWGERERWTIGTSYFLQPANVSTATLSTGETNVNTSLLEYVNPFP